MYTESVKNNLNQRGSRNRFDTDIYQGAKPFNQKKCLNTNWDSGKAITFKFSNLNGNLLDGYLRKIK